jgi:hypothetical protein
MAEGFGVCESKFTATISQSQVFLFTNAMLISGIRNIYDSEMKNAQTNAHIQRMKKIRKM